ncbi:MAG: YjbQ family protein [Firmicutes bacterium]|nr:YjbQ family protein [Bacillota bacterium]
MNVKLYEKQIESQKEFDLILITDEVRNAVKESGIQNGMCAVITQHTTTGIIVNEGLPCVEKDIEIMLERLVPHDYPYVHTHMLPSYGTCSGNSPGHLKSLIAGNHCLFPVIDGRLVLGHAQDIYFAEFDGLLRRRYYIHIMGE